MKYLLFLFIFTSALTASADFDCSKYLKSRCEVDPDLNTRPPEKINPYKLCVDEVFPELRDLRRSFENNHDLRSPSEVPAANLNCIMKREGFTALVAFLQQLKWPLDRYIIATTFTIKSLKEKEKKLEYCLSTEQKFHYETLEMSDDSYKITPEFLKNPSAILSPEIKCAYEFKDGIDDEKSGLKAILLDEKSPCAGRKRHRMIVFEGTEPTRKNLENDITSDLHYGKIHYDAGKATIEKWVQSLPDKNMQITFTGHSLGGDLAQSFALSTEINRDPLYATLAKSRAHEMSTYLAAKENIAYYAQAFYQLKMQEPGARTDYDIDHADIKVNSSSVTITMDGKSQTFPVHDRAFLMKIANAMNARSAADQNMKSIDKDIDNLKNLNVITWNSLGGKGLSKMLFANEINKQNARPGAIQIRSSTYSDGTAHNFQDKFFHDFNSVKYSVDYVLSNDPISKITGHLGEVRVIDGNLPLDQRKNTITAHGIPGGIKPTLAKIGADALLDAKTITDMNSANFSTQTAVNIYQAIRNAIKSSSLAQFTNLAFSNKSDD